MNREAAEQNEPMRLGWREWVALPQLSVTKLKAKVDTGARTSALHVEYLEEQAGGARLMFGLKSPGTSDGQVRECVCEPVDRRKVRDSGGHEELRWVVRTSIVLGSQSWPAELTLTHRHKMRFPMLLGRTAFARRVLIDPAASYCQGSPDERVGC